MKTVLPAMFAVLVIAAANPLYAGLIVVDFSPETTGAPVITGGLGNTFENQYLGDRFTWLGGELTGASIFSDRSRGSVNDPVRIVVLNHFGAGEIPVIDITSTIDFIDTQFASLNSLNRKHASFAPTFLAAGDYYFYMTGALRGVNIAQAVGEYDDRILYSGTDRRPDLELPPLAAGDVFFQIEGNVAAVPEPTAVAIWVLLGFCGAVYKRLGPRRRC